MKDLISGNFKMQMRRGKAGQTVEGICVILSNILKGTAFLHQGLFYMIQCKGFISVWHPDE